MLAHDTIIEHITSLVNVSSVEEQVFNLVFLDAKCLLTLTAEALEAVRFSAYDTRVVLELASYMRATVYKLQWSSAYTQSKIGYVHTNSKVPSSSASVTSFCLHALAHEAVASCNSSLSSGKA